MAESGRTKLTHREFPASQEIAGVNMLLIASSYRELHWHTADKWACILGGVPA
jgi:oxalate decarboxylase